MTDNDKIRSILSQLLLPALEYIMLGLMILCSTSIWLRYGFGLSHINIIKILIIILCSLIVLYQILFKRSSIVPKQWLFWTVFLLVCFSFGALGSSIDLSSNLSSTLKLLIPSLCFLALAFSMEQGEIAVLCRRYVNLMLSIACVSLFFWLFGSVLQLISPSGTISYQWDWTRETATYYGLYFEPQVSDSLFSGMIKNCGIFTEGTMYGFMLCLAYMFERNLYQSRPAVLIILTITIFSTLSTMPILVWLLFEGIMLLANINSYLSNKFQSNQLKIIKVLSLVVVIVALFSLIFFLITGKLSTGSYSVRSDHLINCFRAFFESFPFGYGYGNTDLLKETLSYNQGLSVGIPYFMALGGIGAVLIIIIPVLLYIYYSWKLSNWKNIVFAISFECIFFLTNIVFNSMLQWFVITVIFLKGGYEMKIELADNEMTIELADNETDE